MNKHSARSFLAKWVAVNFVSVFLAIALYIPISNLFSPDEPLHKGLLSIYGISPKDPARTIAKGPAAPGL